MKNLQLFISAGLLGYFLQSSGYILGICATAKKRVRPLSFLLTSVACAIFIFIVRQFGGFTFGVHTMIILLVMNLLCVLLLKVDVKPSILGSLLVSVLVIVGEAVNFLILMPFYTKDVIVARMAEPLFKAWAGVPGNVLLIVIVIVAYGLRVLKRKKNA